MGRSVLASRLVGRHAERAELDAALDAAVASTGGVVFVVGEAGIGKSRLAQAAWANAVARGLPVLSGRAVPSASPVPYRPLAEALCAAVRAGLVAGDPEQAGLGPFRSALGRLVPEWREDDDERRDEPVTAVAEAVVRFARVVAGGHGCLVVLEDLHWADPETLTIVEYLADNLRDERVLCVATLRTEERSAGIDLARALAARRASGLVELDRLDDTQVIELVGSCLDAAEVPAPVIGLAARADGIPFLVEELLAVAVSAGALVDDGEAWRVSATVEPVVPLTFADSVRRRLAAMGADARRVLLAAAVLGRRFDWDLLPAITALDEPAVLAGLRAAVDAQIVAIDPASSAFRFRHALSRDAVLAELLPPERAALSSRALAVIEDAHPELDGAWCELGAELAEQAGDRARAAALFLQAGRRALTAGALASAEAALERADPPEGDPIIVDLEECLTETLSLAGKRDRAVEVGESLLARLGDAPTAATRRAETHLRLARAAVAAADWDEANARLEPARAAAAEADDDTLLARADAVGALAAVARDPEVARRLATSALAAAQRLDLPEVACEALEVLGRCDRPYDLDRARASFARAYAIAEASQLTVWRARALAELGTVELLQGDGLATLEAAREQSLSLGAMAAVAVLDVQLAARLILEDDDGPALVAARRAAELARRYRLAQTLAVALGFEANVHGRAGRRTETERCLEEAFAVATDIPDLMRMATMARAMLAFAEEDRPTAIDGLKIGGVPTSEAPGDQSTGPLPGVLALVRAVAGEVAARLPPPPDEEPVHFIARAWLRYAEAVLAGRGGDEAGAADLVREGDRLLASYGWWRQYGHRLVAEAAVADGWGDPEPWLREALAFFEGRGEDRIAGACRALLKAAGAPVPRRRGDTGAVPAALRAKGVTARELEVLDLLAEGLSNKEIAARLFLSPRTVERHVANLMVKTGVGSRADLVANWVTRRP